MFSPSVRKSITDLSRRRGRAALSVLTLAIAVASVSFFAIPTLIDDAMQHEVSAGQLADVTVAMQPVELTESDLDALEALPNVSAVEPRASVDLRVLIGERRVPARVIGVHDFGDQRVDIVRVESGDFPGGDELLADVQNANVGIYDGRAGDTVAVHGAGERTFTVSGRGRSLPGGELVQDESIVVFYAPLSSVAAMGGDRGYNSLAFLLDDPSADAADAAVGAIRQQLLTVPGFDGFANLPSVRAPGDWPAKSDTEQFAKLLGVITVLALLSATVLIANTMSTLVAEQTREIAVMRTVGARRRQVSRIYLRSALLLGVLGAVVGTLLGVLLSNVLAASFGQQFWAIDVGFGVDAAVVVVSLAIGLVAPPLAALPAIRRGLRLDLSEALDATGSPLSAAGRVDDALRRVGFLPRSVQLGLRNAGRRKRRSLATAMIVALAVGNLLAVLALSLGATKATRSAWGDHLEDVQLFTGGVAPFDEQAESTIRSTPGVIDAEPVLKNSVTLGGTAAGLWAVELEPLFRYEIASGRWFTADEVAAAERVAVIERNIAQVEDVDVGDVVSLSTAAGVAEFSIVGVATNQQENGTALFVPLPTARALLGQPTGARTYWAKMADSDEDFVDRTTGLLEDRLAALGYEVTSEIRYVAEREDVAANRSVTTSIAVLGFVVVAISMIGLANMITTNVLERTREIGVLRSVGARARDVRRIFTTEGVVLALLGWIVGIPVGYVLTRGLLWLVWQVLDVRLPVVFPAVNVLLALVGTVALALVTLHLPVRRAVRFRPGDALRYE